MQIARDLKQSDTAKVPDWLSREDQDAVKEALKYLRAADLAIKTWYIKEKMIKVYKQQCQASWKQIQVAMKVMNETQELRWQLKQAQAESNVYQKRIAELNADESLRYKALEKQLDGLATDFRRYCKAQKLRSGYLVPSQLNKLAARSIYYDFPLPSAIKTSGDVHYRRLMQSYHSSFTDIVKEERKLGLIPKKVEKEFQKLAKKDQTAVSNAIESAEKRYDKLQKTIDKKRQENQDLEKKYRIAGKIYIIAALGDALQELGEQLQY